jgi:hypothetical protein
VLERYPHIEPAAVGYSFTSFTPPPIVLSVDSVGGPQIGTAPHATFATAEWRGRITTGLFGNGCHQLVGAQTVNGSTLQASVALNVTQLL